MRPSEYPNQYDGLAEDPFLDLIREHGLEYALRVRRSLIDDGCSPTQADGIAMWLQLMAKEDPMAKKPNPTQANYRKALAKIDPPTPAPRGGLVSRR